MKKIGFQFKLSAIFIVILATVLMVTVYFIYQRAIIQQKEQLRGRLLSLAKLASLMIDAEKHQLICPKRGSEESSAYEDIKQVLVNIRKADSLIDSVYTMVKSDTENIWMFVVDSGDRRGINAYCGELYNVSELPEMKQAFNGPIVDKEFNEDKWGIFLSGYAPIYGNNGEAVAIVGIDITVQSIKEMQVLLAKRFLLILVLGIIFSLFLGWSVSKSITNPLHRLVEGARSIGKGRFRQGIVLKTKDEFEELAGAFNKMSCDLEETQVKLQRYYLDTIKSLARALEAKDPYTKGHSQRVMHYAVNIAKRLNLTDEQNELLAEVCLLHDIGKIGVPERILTKPGPLTQEEWEMVKMHPKIGEDILKHVEFLQPGLTILRHHHERPDGKGYPDGLNIEQISILASIVSVADAFDAMTSDRPYRKALTPPQAVEILKENKGKQFNGQVVDAFIEYLGENPDIL